TPLVSVVTKIAREHTDYLGTDLADIAREKAGIAKSGVPFVTGERDPAVRQELAAEASRRGAAPVILVDTTRSPTRRLGLLGRHQQANAWVALAPQVDAFVFTVPDSAPEKRRWDLGRLERELGGLTVARAFEPSFAGALERVGVGAATVIVTGSFHTVGDALARLPGFAPVA